jgi:hypothetical protein
MASEWPIRARTASAAFSRREADCISG